MTETISVPNDASSPVTAVFSGVTKITAESAEGVRDAAVEAAKLANTPWKGVAVKAGIAAVVLGLAGGSYMLYRSYWKKPADSVVTSVTTGVVNIDALCETLRLSKESDPSARAAKAKIIDSMLAQGFIDTGRAEDLKVG